MASDYFTSEIFILEHSDCIKEEDGPVAYWMIDKCPLDFQDTTIIQRCEDGRNFGLSSVPTEWTGVKGRIWTFKNIYCALCHGFGLDDVTNWEIYATCEDDFIFPSGNMDLAEINEHCDIRIVPVSPSLQRLCQVDNGLITQCQRSSSVKYQYRLL